MQLLPKEKLPGLQFTGAPVKGQYPNHLTEHPGTIFCVSEERDQVSNNFSALPNHPLFLPSGPRHVLEETQVHASPALHQATLT